MSCTDVTHYLLEATHALNLTGQQLFMDWYRNKQILGCLTVSGDPRGAGEPDIFPAENVTRTRPLLRTVDLRTYGLNFFGKFSLRISERGGFLLGIIDGDSGTLKCSN